MKKEGIFIFDTEENSNKTECLYTHFVPLVEPLLKGYEDLFNYCSLYNKVSPLYKVFGKNNLTNFSMDINKIYNIMIYLEQLLENGDTVSIDLTAYQDKIDEMRTYAKRKALK